MRLHSPLPLSGIHLTGVRQPAEEGHFRQQYKFAPLRLNVFDQIAPGSSKRFCFVGEFTDSYFHCMCFTFLYQVWLIAFVSINDEELRADWGVGTMRFCTICYLVADSRGQDEIPAVGQLGMQFAFET